MQLWGVSSRQNLVKRIPVGGANKVAPAFLCVFSYLSPSLSLIVLSIPCTGFNGCPQFDIAWNPIHPCIWCSGQRLGIKHACTRLYQQSIFQQFTHDPMGENSLGSYRFCFSDVCSISYVKVSLSMIFIHLLIKRQFDNSCHVPALLCSVFIQPQGNQASSYPVFQL